jgi:excisionase family DNA binding protein
VTSPSPEEFLTVAEVASALRLNQQTIRNWIDAGTLPALRIGRRVRVRRRDFDQLLERSYRPASHSQDDSLKAADFWSGEVHGEPVTPAELEK